MEEKLTSTVVYNDTILIWAQSIQEGDKSGYVCPIGMSCCEGGVDTSVEGLEAHERHSWFRFLIQPMDEAPQQVSLPLTAVEGAAVKVAAGRVQNRNVVYGDIVTLRHIETGCFLSVAYHEPSLLDPGNIQARFELTTSDISCWFKLLPRFRVRVDGQNLQPGDEVVFESFESKMWLHVSQDSIDKEPTYFEANFSSSNTNIGFLIQLYDPTGECRKVVQEDPVQRRRLVAGQGLQLFHKEEFGFISVNTVSIITREALPAGAPKMTVPRRTTRTETSIEPIQGGELQKQKGLHPEAMFIVESGGCTLRGGILTLDRPFRLKNIATRMYLCLAPSTTSQKFELTLEPDASRSGTRFMFIGAGSDDGEAMLNVARVNGLYRICSQAFPSRWIGTRHLTVGADVAVVATEGAHFRDALEVYSLTNEDTERFCGNMIPGVKKYLMAWTMAGTIPPDVSLILVPFKNLLRRALSFMQIKDFSILQRRQNCMVHLGLANLLLLAIAAPFNETYTLEQLQLPPQGRRLDPVLNHVADITSMTFELMTTMIKKHPVHAKLLTPAIPFLGKFMSFGMGVQDVMLEVLTDNELISMIPEEETVKQFFQWIKERGRHPIYIQFLCHLLTSNGRAIRRMQDIVLQSLRKNLPILLRTRLKDGTVQVLLPPVRARMEEMFLPDPVETTLDKGGGGDPSGWRWVTLETFSMSEAHRELRCFYEICVELLGLLCADCNQSGIQFVSALIHEDVPLLVFQNTQIIPTIKASYAKLCRQWLLEEESPPSRKVKIVDPSLEKRTSSKSNAKVIARYRMECIEQFKLLQTLQMENQEMNLYIQALLEMARSFILRSSTHADQDFVPALVVMLDGKTDICTGDRYECLLGSPCTAANHVKKMICDLFLVIVEKSTDTYMKRIVEEDDALNADLFEEMCKPKLFGCPTKDFISILMDMAKYNYAPLVRSAVHLLLQVYSIQWLVKDQLDDLTLLGRVEEVRTYQTLTDNHNQLYKSLYMQQQEYTKTKLKEVQTCLNTMIGVMKDPNAQNMVYALGTIGLIETFYDMRARPGMSLKFGPILNACLEFMLAYAKGPAKHQKQMSPMVKSLIRDIEGIDSDLVVKAVLAIVQDNRDIVRDIVNDSLMLWVLGRCYNNQCVVAATLLQALIFVDGHLLYKNMESVMNLINRRGFPRDLLYLYCSRGLQREKLHQLIDCNDFDRNPGGTMRYFVETMRFFALVTHAGHEAPISPQDSVKEYMNTQYPAFYRCSFAHVLMEQMERQDLYDEILSSTKPELILDQVALDLTEKTLMADPTFFSRLLGMLRALSMKFPRPGSTTRWCTLLDLVHSVSKDFESTTSVPVAIVTMMNRDMEILNNLDIRHPLLSELLENRRQKVKKEKALAQNAEINANPQLKLQHVKAQYTEWLQKYPILHQLTQPTEDDMPVVSHVSVLADVLARGILDDTLTAQLLRILTVTIPSLAEDSEEDEEELSEDREEDPLSPDKPAEKTSSYEGVGNQELAVTIHDIQNMLNAHKVMDHVLLLVESNNVDIYRNALQLGCAMVAGLNVAVQTAALNYFTRSSHGVFVKFRQVLQNGMAALRLRENDENELQSILDEQVQPVLKFMKDLSEGHNFALQECFRSQVDSVVNVNVVREVVFFVHAVFKNLNSVTVRCAEQGLDTLTELCQGPCKGNQEVLVENNMAWVVRDFCLTYYSFLKPEKQDTGDLTPSQKERLLQKGITMLLSITEGINMQSKAPQGLFDPGMFEQLIHLMNESWIRGEIANSNIMKDERWRDLKDGPLDFPTSAKDLDELALGFSIFIFLVTVSHYDKSHQLTALLKKQMSYKYFHEHTGQIEIARLGQLERVFFRIPEACWLLPEQTKEDIQVLIRRDTTEVKHQDFVSQWDGLIGEMQIYHKSSMNSFIRIFMEKGSQLADLSLVLSMLISFLLMVFMHHNHPVQNYYLSQDEFDALQGLGIFQVFMEGFLYFGWLSLRGKVLIDQHIALRLNELAKAKASANTQKYHNLLIKYAVYQEWASKKSKKTFASKVTKVGYSLMILMRCQEFYTSSLFASAAPLGIAIHPIFFSIPIFRVIQRSDSLQNVIKAVTLKWVDLTTTAMLGVVVIFLFSMVSFYYFDDAYYDSDLGEGFTCQSLLRCFAMNVIYGLRKGGGISDALQHPNWNESPQMVTARLLFDFLFWLIMIIIFLNIIFGIILDTFADLRDLKAVRDKDKRTVCFICGIQAFEFDKHGGGFGIHYHEDHNMWKYLFFRHYLLHNKDVQDHTGQESYVNIKCNNQDLSFFPQEKAMCLMGARESNSAALREEERELLIVAKVTKLSQVVVQKNTQEVARRRKLENIQSQEAARRREGQLATLLGPRSTSALIPDKAYDDPDPELELSAAASEEGGNSKVPSVTLDQALQGLSQGKRDQMLLDMLNMCRETSNRIDQAVARQVRERALQGEK